MLVSPEPLTPDEYYQAVQQFAPEPLKARITEQKLEFSTALREVWTYHFDDGAVVEADFKEQYQDLPNRPGFEYARFTLKKTPDVNPLGLHPQVLNRLVEDYSLRSN
jgi:hypothetical protein